MVSDPSWGNHCFNMEDERSRFTVLMSDPNFTTQRRIHENVQILSLYAKIYNTELRQKYCNISNYTGWIDGFLAMPTEQTK